MARPLDDYKIWDNREPVTYVSERNSGDVTYALTDCKRRQLNFRELAASGGVYTSQDRAWLVPVAILPVGLTPKMADRLTDAEGDTWTVLSAELNTWRTWWKLPARNLVLHADLRSTIDVLRPFNAQDDQGNRSPTSYTTQYASVPCRVQEQGGATEPNFGKLGTVRKYTIYLGQRVTVTNEDRVQFGALILQIVSYTNPDRIDELMSLDCEEIP